MARGEVRVEPPETDEVLANPDMGWETFHKFADEDPALAGLPSTVAYFRWYWHQVEPEDGRVNWEGLDGLLAGAKRAGQKLAFRVMTAGTSGPYMHSPKWLKDLGCPGFEYKAEKGRTMHWMPDLDSPIFLDKHLRLISALGERYDGHADLSHMDIGSVGFWGEWHTLHTGVPAGSEETRMRIIEAYLSAFRKTPLVMCLGYPRGVRHVCDRGGGWRADCLGDLGGFSPTWNHMKVGYPKLLGEAKAYEDWKTGPVAFESCWDMRRWKKEGWDIDYILDYALGLHTTYVNNKSAPIPEGTRGQVERFLRRAGYRFVVRRVEHAGEVKPGEEMEVRTTWENVGVAPAYADYVAGVALAGADGKVKATGMGEEPVRKWLPSTRPAGKPGKHESVVKVKVSAGTKPGRYAVKVGIVEAKTGRAVVKLANEGRDETGWHRVSEVKVG